MSIKLIFSLVAMLVLFAGVDTTGFVFAEEKNINFFLDKAWYEPRDIIQIEGWVNDVNSTEIQIEIINPDDSVIVHQRIALEEIHEIDHQIAAFGGEWSEYGFYQIKVSHLGESETKFFGFGNFDPKIFEPKINLDKETYSWTDTVEITIISPNDNKNIQQIEEIEIDISTRTGTLSSYILEETGVSDGIFSGIVTLTGYADFDVNQDGKLDDVRGYTGGVGPEEGNLSANPSDTLKITYSTPFYEEEIEKKAPIEFQKAIVHWAEIPIYSDSKALARVIDPDMRLLPEVADSIKVLIKSYPQKYSKEYTLRETEINSGVFEGNIRLYSENKMSGLFAPPGSIVSINYVDTTLPSSYLVKKINIIANATVTGVQSEERPPESIPSWVKNTAKWWSEESIGDDAFIRGIEHLIDKEIIIIEKVKPDPNQSPTVPHWLKKSAGWWSQELISDEEFVKAIQHLMKLGVIRV
jgi:hypothetical protein